MKITFEQYNAIIRKGNWYLNNIKKWRKGQCWYNALADICPEVAQEINGHDDLDPFHFDNNITNLFNYLLEEKNA